MGQATQVPGIGARHGQGQLKRSGQIANGRACRLVIRMLLRKRDPVRLWQGDRLRSARTIVCPPFADVSRAPERKRVGNLEDPIR